MEKYDLVPQQLIYEGTIAPGQMFTPDAGELSYISETHDPGYISRVQSGTITRSEMRRIGFPYSEQLFRREVAIMNGSVQSAEYALEYGIAFNMAGGTHHAHFDFGEGFCIFNDIAVAANFLLYHRHIKKILVIDLDVHQGNGTASIFSDRPEVFTFSMHCENNFPARKTNSDLDIGLKDHAEDQNYLEILSGTLSGLIKKLSPEFIIYQCGVDVLATDNLGRMNLSIPGVHARDEIVLKEAKRNSIPMIGVMGGGYSTNISTIIEAHSGIFRLARNLYE